MIVKRENIFICLLIMFSSSKGYPTKRDDIVNDDAFKDEKKYPNGTVIGKYRYKDKDGNPVHVKYFADDSSYGVELKSIKVFDADPDTKLYKLPDLENMIPTSATFQPLVTACTVNAMLNKEFNGNKTYNPLTLLNSYSNKTNRFIENNKSNDGYEIFLGNDIRSTEKGNKEKVKVYLDKNRRNTWNPPYRYKTSEYCKRF